MSILIGIVIFIFGLCVGSFLNAYLFRFNTGYSMWDRSACPTCGHTLASYELIPLVSFLWQGGRCRACDAHISWQYPLVEAAAGLAAVGAVWLYGVSMEAAVLAVILWLFLLISVYDIRHTIIPNQWVYTALLLSGGLLFIDHNALITGINIERIVTAAGIFIFFYLLWRFSAGMGFGDAKLAAVAGLLLPPAAAVSAIIFSFWVGAAVSLALIGWQRLQERKGREEMGMQSAVPFGPYLVAGIVFVLFTGVQLF